MNKRGTKQKQQNIVQIILKSILLVELRHNQN